MTKGDRPRPHISWRMRGAEPVSRLSPLPFGLRFEPVLLATSSGMRPNCVRGASENREKIARSPIFIVLCETLAPGGGRVGLRKNGMHSSRTHGPCGPVRTVRS